MPDIAIWNRCNNHCVMCTNPLDFQKEEDSVSYGLSFIQDRNKDLKLENHENINLTGGEPTIHPNFFEIVSWFRNLYPKNYIVIATNGRMLSYPNFTKKLLSFNNIRLEIALHGYNANTHDTVTRSKGSFKQTIKGINNVIKYKKTTDELELRIIITKLTYQYLDKLLAFIYKKFATDKIDIITLIFLEMEGQAQDNKDIVCLKYQDVYPYLEPLFDKWKNKFKDLRLYHFPLCTIPPKLWPYTWRTLRGDEVKFLPSCKKCLYKKYCLGIHRDYLKIEGKKEFKPIKTKFIITKGKAYYHPITKIKIK